jgi:dihydroxy-acid dehydratase
MASRKPRRSQQWFGRDGKMGFIYRSWVKNRGIPHDQFDGRPVIGICNTYSELTPCNSHFRTLAEHVKAGVWEAGGFPLEFPVMSLGETLLRPTAMLYRIFASMDVEESIRGNPIDGVVLLMGCDKTTPSLIMGASSVDLPTIGVSAARCSRAGIAASVSARARTPGRFPRTCALARSPRTNSTRPRAACTAPTGTA